MNTVKRKWLLLVILLVVLGASSFIVYWIFDKRFAPEFLEKAPPASPPVTNTSSIPIALGFKTYRNEEWEFEFQYPKDWKLEENSFYSPFSKFNLQGNSSAENYNPFRPHFLLNIVTPDFADRAVISFKNLNANTSTITIASTNGMKYEYEIEGTTQIGIDLPFEKYRMILGTEKEYEDIFNQILSSFKFLK